MALTGQKQMSAEASKLDLSYTPEHVFLPATIGLGNWQYDKLHDYHYFSQVRKIPLEGIYSEKLGLQLEAVALQKPWNPVVGFNYPVEPTQGRVNLEYFVSTTPPWVNQQEREAVLSLDGVGDVMTFNRSSAGAGQAGGLSWEQAQIASNTTFTVNSNVGLSSRGWLSVLNSQLFGSNTAIANRVLYVTFIWVIEDPANAGVSPLPDIGIAYLPALRLVLAGTVFKTKKKGWLDLLTRNAKIEPRQG